MSVVKIVTRPGFYITLKGRCEYLITGFKMSNKNSKLILKPSGRLDAGRLKVEFKNYGVENQLEFFDKQSYLKVEDHLKLYNNIDIGLDTFPYNGVTTTFEALWSGVPVLVMKGFNFNSRCGESININLGMIEMIARDEEDYILKAIKLSKNIDYLSEIRKTLREKANKSPLFDSESFGHDFTKLIKSIWENYISRN